MPLANGSLDVLIALASLLVDQCDRVDRLIPGIPSGHPPEILDRLPPPPDARFPVFREIAQRHERRDRLAGALDDQPLPGGGLVKELAEVLPDVKRRNRSHSDIIAL